MQKTGGCEILNTIATAEIAIHFFVVVVPSGRDPAYSGPIR